MVARTNGEQYGELIAYRFPRQSLVFGPRRVTSRMDQDTEVSRQVSLWDQGGSQVIRGELLVIPIEASGSSTCSPSTCSRRAEVPSSSAWSSRTRGAW